MEQYLYLYCCYNNNKNKDVYVCMFVVVPSQPMPVCVRSLINAICLKLFTGNCSRINRGEESVKWS